MEREQEQQEQQEQQEPKEQTKLIEDSFNILVSVARERNKLSVQQKELVFSLKSHEFMMEQDMKKFFKRYNAINMRPKYGLLEVNEKLLRSIFALPRTNNCEVLRIHKDLRIMVGPQGFKIQRGRQYEYMNPWVLYQYRDDILKSLKSAKHLSDIAPPFEKFYEMFPSLPDEFQSASYNRIQYKLPKPVYTLAGKECNHLILDGNSYQITLEHQYVYDSSSSVSIQDWFLIKQLEPLLDGFEKAANETIPLFNNALEEFPEKLKQTFAKELMIHAL